MGFVSDLKSLDPEVIKSSLLPQLDAVTQKDVLLTDQNFFKLRDRKAQNAFLEKLQSANPILLERWTHYCWLRLELSSLAYQRATLNKLAAIKRQAPDVPLIDSIDAAIYDDALAGTPIEKSIANLREIRLQIVATEHPTDPLSRQALVTITKIANEMEKNNPDEASIRQSLELLQKTDPIPPSKRPVVEEVERSINKVLDKLYNSLPQFIYSILLAYRKAYGETLFQQHKEAILQALEGGLQPTGEITLPILGDASWAGADADGNENVTPEAMRHAIRLHRIRVADKHIASLDGGIIAASKKVERQLRKDIFKLNTTQFQTLTTLGDKSIELMLAIQNFQNDAASYLTSRNYDALVANYVKQEQYIQNLTLNAEQRAVVMKIVSQQHEKAILLTKLARFSGAYSTAAVSQEDLVQGIHLLNKAQFQTLAQMGEGDQAIGLMKTFNTFQIDASCHLANKDYEALLANLANQELSIQNLTLEPTQRASMMDILAKQYEKAVLLKKSKMTSDAGPMAAVPPGDKAEEEKLEQGALQKLQKLFEQFRDTIRGNIDDIKVQDSQSHTYTQTEFAIQEYQKIMSEHQEIFKLFPDLQLPMRCFGIQLNCFGMTYGRAHIRQDSSIYIKVWNALLNDLCQEQPFAQFSLLAEVKKKGYQGLSVKERVELHKRLHANDAEGRQILHTINQRRQAGNYLKDAKYRSQPDFAWVRRELERLELALRHDDMFENIIISNCESASNILEVESLLNVFALPRPKITVVPLLEKREDLENYESILTDFIAAKRHQNNPVAEIMVGFSDTERVTGLPALIPVQEVQEKFIKLAARFGVQAKIYHGPGGDANRGSVKRRDGKATLQGEACNKMLTTAQSTAHYRETQFSEAYKNVAQPSRLMELSQLSEPLQQALQKFTVEGGGFYEHLHDTKKGLGKLLEFYLGQGARWMVDFLNSSSRSAQRGFADNDGDRAFAVQKGGVRPKGLIDLETSRAITMTQLQELLADNIHLVMGPGVGLRAIGKEAAERLYDSSATFRDIVHKTTLGLVRTKFFITSLALFDNHREFLPKNAEERKQWALECGKYYPQLLQKMNMKEMMKTDKAGLRKMLSRLFAYIEEESIQTRDFIASLTKRVNFEAYHSPFAPQEMRQPTDLIFHHPEWRAQEQAVSRESEPLFLLMARLNFQVANGLNLDEVYQGLNEASAPYMSSLSGVSLLLANVGAGLTCARGMLPAFYENIHLDYRENLRPGVSRSEQERIKLYGSGGKFQFFNERKQMLENFFAEREAKKEPDRIKAKL